MPDRAGPPSPPDPPEAELAIRIQGLDKVYAASGGEAPTHALKEVDLEIPKGSMFGLLGPNGAGKSTLINILAGLVIKTGGKVEIAGHDMDAAWRQARLSIGVMPQELVMDPFFSPRQTLELQAGLYGVPSSERRTEELLATVGLTEKADVYSRTLSGGMRRRLMVAKALVHRPPILILDEPTAGVDVELRQTLWREVRAINDAGATILLTTHHFEEVEAMCDRIAIIDRGRVIRNGPIGEMVAELDQKDLVLRLAGPLAAVPAALDGLDARLNGGNELVVRFRPTEVKTLDLLNRAREAGLEVEDFSTQEPSLEDLFLSLTSRRGGGSETVA